MAKVKSRRLKVISVCSECGEPVCATKDDKAYRHGFPRFKRARLSFGFSQEDGEACKGSGKEVAYRKR